MQAGILAGQQWHRQHSLIEALRALSLHSLNNIHQSGSFLCVFIIKFFQNILKSNPEFMLEITTRFQKRNSNINNASKQTENYSSTTLLQESAVTPSCAHPLGARKGLRSRTPVYKFPFYSSFQNCSKENPEIEWEQHTNSNFIG